MTLKATFVDGAGRTFGQPVVSAAEGAVVDRSGGGRGGVTTDGQIGRTAGTVASPQLLAGASAAPEIVLSSMGPTKVSPAAGVVLVPPVPNPNSDWTLQSLAKCLLPDGARTPRRRFRLPIRRSPQIAPIGGRGRSSPSLLRSGPIVASFEAPETPSASVVGCRRGPAVHGTTTSRLLTAGRCACNQNCNFIEFVCLDQAFFFNTGCRKN